MTPFWSAFVIAITLLNLAGLAWLLFATARRPKDARADHETTGHVWDENIAELNNPLPRWWLVLFVLTLVFALAYVALYPGFGSYAGWLGWSSSRELERDIAATDARLEPMFAKFRGRSIDELARDEHALKIGQSVFVNNCAACHGSDARGAAGFPNLADRDWQWGGTADDVLASVSHGRAGTMPALAAALPNDGLAEVTNYVRSLSGLAYDTAKARAGKTAFETVCTACHGVGGTGNTKLGAPNLADETWLYGSSEDSIARTLRYGRNGRMPAWSKILGEDRTRLVVAWVLARSAEPRDRTAVHEGGAP